VITKHYRFLAIGSGLAGLTFALRAAEHGTVCVLTKADVTEANTSYAQGGIAAAIGEADSWELHEQDTLKAGAGQCDREAVRYLVQNAPEAIRWLLNIGTRFDLEGDALALGMEGGHSRHRIVHSGDRTGQEVERAMVEAVRAHPNITVVEHAFVTHLLVADGRCRGAVAQIDELGLRVFSADAVLLATGGCGKMYMHTTNPLVATADGIALAVQAGARVEHMEFMQFHPTTLYHPQMRSFLVTEAVRGAGGTLRNHLGQRFMYDYDERLELAPRDVVARAMEAEMKRLNTWCLYLDTTHLPREMLRREFPTTYATLEGIGVEMHKEWVPVVPAQHYSCGGVKTDLQGATSLPGLYAAGEAACTGVHGANRLASNSLLEALVFATAAADACAGEPALLPVEPEHPTLPPSVPESEAIRIRRHLQHLMTESVGIVRSDVGLRNAQEQIERLLTEYDQLAGAPHSQYSLETHNLLMAAREVVRGALGRRENVGLHFNVDLKDATPPNTSAPGASAAAPRPTPAS
jgi:L-aspartate oxidase